MGPLVFHHLELELSLTHCACGALTSYYALIKLW